MFAADQLLNPISAEQPCGADLSFSPEFDAINQARKFDDPSLDQGEWVTDLKEADWAYVVKHSAALLASRSKDMRLAVWLAEAGAHQHQLRGLGEALRVLAGLFDTFWDQGLYPEADGDDHERRIGNLGWLLARIPALLRAMPVTDGNGSAYTSVDFDVARKQAGGDSPKLADLEAARRANSAQFRARFAADAQYCLEALLELERAADRRLGQDSPGFANARDALDTMLHLMPAAAETTAAAAEAAHAAAAGEMPHASPQIHSGPPGAIHTRSQGIAQLRAVAEFFRRTEPHSPVSYFADKAANAAEQDLHAWLRSVVKDQGSLAHIEELLGVQPPASN